MAHNEPQTHPQQQMPQRLSALYQFHNAPEVAPAHGLEYDDTPYPSSDKYPVLHTGTVASSSYETKYTGKHAFNDNRPPRIIFGMKVKTFLAVAFVMILIVVGAAVGGSVGGRALRQSDGGDGTWPAGGLSSSTTASATQTATSTFSAAVPTYTPLSDCPASNNTMYTSSHASTSTTTTSASPSYLVFTKYCGLNSPLSVSGTTTLSDAFVYSFSDCVELCASFNVQSQKAECNVAVYRPGGSRPGNCWVGSADFAIGDLSESDGTDVAVISKNG